MGKGTAAVGSIIFFLMAPAIVSGAIPAWLSGGGFVPPLEPVFWRGGVGWLLIVTGLSVLLHAFTRFVVNGLGTPAPVAPCQHLVVAGLYGHVRNPMYLAVLTIVLGQALARGSATVGLYAAILGVAFTLFVRLYEEPTLAIQFGREYEAYCRAVPRWRPRLRPWHPDPPPISRTMANNDA